MKTFVKVIVITACVFIALGITLSVIAAALGASPANWEGREVMDFNESYTGVTALKLDIGAAEVRIEKGAEFKIVAENVSQDGFKSTVENGLWIVQEKWKTQFSFFSWNGGFFWDKTPRITIYLPEEFIATELTIDMGAGKITADGLRGEKASLSVGAGELRAENVALKDANISVGAGSVSLSGSITGESEAECGTGQIELLLIGKESDYNYRLEVGIGEILLNDDSYKGSSSKDITNNGAENSLRVHCGVGKINIQIGE